ncbi:LGFP repeat-containing protein [Nocardia sp. CDC160]|uniref:LGFP repeat-containing protein n=1 Tax=Nocardia sp. CDC160 TaxID=3112166 RepID=UPI002DBEC65F|nr:esterase [Nocardia sp. CDC160]MEC3916772.1 esterase [Nocardia sp. CDC160]
MHHFARRTAGIIAALAVVTALGAACNDKDKNSSSSTTTTAASQTHTAETKISTPNGEITLSGAVLEKYEQMGGANSPLGLPTGPAKDAPDGGSVQEFTGGAIYASSVHGTHVVWGEIRKAWEEDGGPSGKLGYPTSDEFDIPGGKQSDFSGGSITWVDNKITVTEK